MFSGRPIFEPPRFLTCTAAAQQLLEIVEKRRKAGEEIGMCLVFLSDSFVSAFDEKTKIVGLARIGWPTQKVISCKYSIIF